MDGESLAENLGRKHSGVSGVTENFSHFFVIFLLNGEQGTRTCQVGEGGDRCGTLRFFFTRKWE